MRTKKNYREASIPIIFNKSNLIINAIGKPSATSQKLLNMALSCLEVDPSLTPDELKYYQDLIPVAGADYSSGIVACFKQSDFKNLIPGNSSSWTSTRNFLCSKEGLIKDYTLTMPPNKNSNLPGGVIALVTAAYFDDVRDMIYVKFQDNDYMREMLTKISNTTKLKLNTICKFRGTFCIRIFEILESSIFLDTWNRSKKGLPVTSTHTITIGVERLKWTIGYTYISDDTPKATVEVILSKVKKCVCDADYDRIYDSYKMYLKGTTWYEFERDVLAPSIKELNKNVSDRNYSYESDKGGSRKKKFITFTVDEFDKALPSLSSSPSTPFEVVEENDKTVAINKVRAILDKYQFSKYFSDSNCYSLFTIAEKDYSRIEKAYEAFNQRVPAELRKRNEIDSMSLMCSLVKKNAEANNMITYDDYISDMFNFDSIDESVKSLKQIIRSANYQVAQLSEKELALIEEKRKFLGLDLGLSLNECADIGVKELCDTLKRKDFDMMKSFKADGPGQISMNFEQ